MRSSVTFGQARDSYLQRATLKSRHTVASYARAIALFVEFLSDTGAPGHALPIMHARTTTVMTRRSLRCQMADPAVFRAMDAIAGSDSSDDNRLQASRATTAGRHSEVVPVLGRSRMAAGGLPLAKAKRTS